MSVELIKQMFAAYYEKHPPQAPPSFGQREFGFGSDKKIDYRHISFKNERDFQNYFISNAPLYASFSAGYYEFPDGRPMPKKGLIGADLIFEFDQECPHGTLFCPDCLEKTKQDTFHLIEEFLCRDFGVSRKDIYINFSGSRGYHVHVRNKDVQRLDGRARREIADYLQARNFDVRLLKGASASSKGWKGRAARTVRAFVENPEYKRYGVSAQFAKKVTERKDEILLNIDRGNYDVLKGADSRWESVIDSQVVHMNADIDQSVTLDMARLIRVPTTLHGGSSLLAAHANDLERFNPLKDTIAFHNYPVKVKVLKDVLQFVLNETTFGPFKAGEEASVPEYAAMGMLCKQAADMIK